MSDYYVYELIDPRTDRVFYVGKGRGDRHKQHVRDAQRGVKSYKCNTIRKILELGLDVGSRIVKEFKSEDAAFAFEVKHIERIGIQNLTNVAPGGRGVGYPFQDNQVKDAEIAFHRLRRATKYFTQPSGWWFCGKWFPLDMGKVIDLKKMFTGLSIKYGTFDEWFLASKVETVDGARG